jgi:hypothetical protein
MVFLPDESIQRGSRVWKGLAAAILAVILFGLLALFLWNEFVDIWRIFAG